MQIWSAIRLTVMQVPDCGDHNSGESSKNQIVMVSDHAVAIIGSCAGFSFGTSVHLSSQLDTAKVTLIFY